MSDKVLSFEVRSRGARIKNLPNETYARATDSAQDIYQRIAAKARIDINRLRVTKVSDGALVPNDPNVTLDELVLQEGSGLFVKDLGPQISWRTVFIIEYLGPLLIHPLVFALRSVIYQPPIEPASFSAKLSLAMITLHFLKRELETVFVHRFSAATMPAFNIFKNSAHYWLLAGANIALFTYSPHDTPTSTDPTGNLVYLPYLAVLLYVVGELGNLSAHLTLMNLRRAGTKERGIPTTGVFAFVPVTCPNYFFEVLAWVAIWLANRSFSTLVFIIVAGVQMALWARKKERRYRKEFPDRYKRKTFAMIPGII